MARTRHRTFLLLCSLQCFGMGAPGSEVALSARTAAGPATRPDRTRPAQVPRAGAALPARPSRSPGGFAVPTQTLPSAGTDAAFHSGRGGACGPRRRAVSDSHAAPGSSGAAGREAPDFRPPPPGTARTVAIRHRELPLRGEPRDWSVGGGARQSRRQSRACRSHVSAPVTCSRRSQSRRTLSWSKEAVVRHRPRPEMFSSPAPAALGAVAATTRTATAAATRRPSLRG